MALDELYEATTLPGRNLHIRNLTKALEERPKFVLGHIAGQAANKDRGVVWVGELIHGLRLTVVAHRRVAHSVHAAHLALSATLHGAAAHATGSSTALRFVLWCRGRDAHWTIATVYTLHLGQCALLILFVGESDESVAARHAADGVGHDFGRLARRETILEERHQNVFVDFRAQVANENGVFGTTVIATIVSQVRECKLSSSRYVRPICKATTRSPIELERSIGVGNKLPVQSQRFGSSGRVGEINKAIASITTVISTRW